MWCHPCCLDGKDHLPSPAGNALPNAAQDVVGCLCCEGMLPAQIIFFFLRSFFAKLLSTQLFPSPSWDQQSSPGKRTFHFFFLNFMRFPSAHFSSLSKSLKFYIILCIKIVATECKHRTKSMLGLGRQGKTLSKTCWYKQKSQMTVRMEKKQLKKPSN